VYLHEAGKTSGTEGEETYYKSIEVRTHTDAEGEFEGFQGSGDLPPVFVADKIVKSDVAALEVLLATNALSVLVQAAIQHLLRFLLHLDFQSFPPKAHWL
jgi:hypothetical protein